jgi:hypothetical protein
MDQVKDQLKDHLQQRDQTHWCLAWWGWIPINYVPCSNSPISGIRENLQKGSIITNLLFWFKYHDGISPKVTSESSLEFIFKKNDRHRKITITEKFLEYAQKYQCIISRDGIEIETTKDFNDVVYQLFNEQTWFYSF